MPHHILFLKAEESLCSVFQLLCLVPRAAVLQNVSTEQCLLLGAGGSLGRDCSSTQKYRTASAFCLEFCKLTSGMFFLRFSAPRGTPTVQRARSRAAASMRSATAATGSRSPNRSLQVLLAPAWPQPEWLAYLRFRNPRNPMDCISQPFLSHLLHLCDQGWCVECAALPLLPGSLLRGLCSADSALALPADSGAHLAKQDSPRQAAQLHLPQEPADLLQIGEAESQAAAGHEKPDDKAQGEPKGPPDLREGSPGQQAASEPGSDSATAPQNDLIQQASVLVGEGGDMEDLCGREKIPPNQVLNTIRSTSPQAKNDS